MNRLILEYAGQPQECEGWPPQYGCILKLANCFFPHVQVEGIETLESPVSAVRSTEDLQAVYGRYKATGVLHLRLIGTELSCHNLDACLPPPGFSRPSRENTTEDSTDSEALILPCYKCQGTRPRFGCKRCNNKGTIDVRSLPKYMTLLKFVSQEVERWSLLTFTEKQPEKPTVHYGVVCAICNCCPVIGIRYKCSVCKGYSCCAKCESRSTHPHPFIKLKQFQPEECEKPKMTGKSKNRQCDPESRLCLRFVKDVEGREGEIHTPQSRFHRTWRIRNEGKTAWTPGCKVIFINGDFEGPAVDLPPLSPAEQCDVRVTCTAPSEEGEYYSHWRALDAEGMRFGQRLTIKIRVVKGDVDSGNQLQWRFEQLLAEHPAETLAALQTAEGDLSRAAALLRLS